MMFTARKVIRWATLCTLALVPASTALAEPYDIIISGIGGSEQFSERFLDWGRRLRAVLIEDLGHPEANIQILTEQAEGEGAIGPTSTLENVRAAVDAMRGDIGPDDDLFIYLIGHGNHVKRMTKFNLPGPDLEAQELDSMLTGVNARRTIVINAFSASAGFINVLGAPGRIVTSATKSITERNATRFMEFFLQGIEDGSADQDRDERISVLEACQQAAVLTEAFFLAEGLIPTEHPLIDDSGDRLGSRLLSIYEDQSDDTHAMTAVTDLVVDIDGALARVVYLKDFIFPDSVPREMVNGYLAILDNVEQLKARKEDLAEKAYYDELLALLVKAARANREIRTIIEAESSETEATPAN